jgi:ferredoxin-NADP reductase
VRPSQAAASETLLRATSIFTIALALGNANFRLLYACRRRQELALADELRQRIGERLTVFVSEEGSRVNMGAEIGRLAPAGELYVCGPIGMLEEAKRSWAQSGRPHGLLRFETFGSSGHFAAEPFKVKIPRLNLEVEVSREQTMLQALEAAGVEMISDCLRG